MNNLYRNMKANLGAVLILAWAFSIGTASTADAALMLRLDDPTTSGIDVTVADQGVGDVNATVGAVTFIGDVGAFDVNVSTGISKPVLGSAAFPSIDLNSVDVTTVSGGSLQIWLTDTGFTALGPGMMAIGGVTSGNITYSAWADDSNVEFGMGNLIGTLGPYSSGPFSGTAGTLGLVASSAPYSLTQQVSIVHTKAGATSFDATVVVPEPATLALLGLGLFGVVAFGRRRTL